MGPKKAKDTVGENYWKKFIEDTPLNDNNWEVKVIIIEAAGSDHDRNYLSSFEAFAVEDKRFVIKNICKAETTFMINQLGGDKKVKDDNLQVFEAGEAYLKEKRDIPPDVWALIIKHLILKMKEEYLYIKRQRLEVREGLRQESTTMVDRTEVRGTVNVKPTVVIESPPVTKGKKKKGEQEAVSQSPDLSEGKKYNTVLRVRGEEWRDKVYVDDFPKDGPNIYVALTGFVESLLPVCLIQIGVPLTAIIQIRVNPTPAQIPSDMSKRNKKGKSQTDLLIEKSMNFWDHLQTLRIENATADVLMNTAFVKFSPSYADSDQLIDTSENIYDEISFLMYDVQDLTRQHSHYLQNMYIINIPHFVCDDSCFEDYMKNMEDIPLECVTIYSVMGSILEAVDRYNDNNVETAQSSKSSLSSLVSKAPIYSKNTKVDDKIEKAEHLVKGIFSILHRTDSTKKSFRVTYGHEFESLKDPVVIQYGDFAKYSTFHLSNIYLEEFIRRFLINMPCNTLWRNLNGTNDELKLKMDLHVNVLLSCLERNDVETHELNRLVHILTCRKLYNNRSSLKKKHISLTKITDLKNAYLKRSIFAEPLQKYSFVASTFNSISTSLQLLDEDEASSNNSYEENIEICRIKHLFECPDICGLISATEIANQQPVLHYIDEFEYFEDFSGYNALQIVQEAFNSFSNVDYKYCEITGCVVLMFFNSHDEDAINREQWRCHIPTQVCLQDFFDFVLEENYDWIEKEEKIYDQNIIEQSQSVAKDANIILVEKSCTENMEVEFDLLIDGSIKYKEIAKIDDTTEITDTNQSTKKSSLSPISTEDSKSGKKAKSSKVSTPMQLGKSFMAPRSESSPSLEMPSKPFYGYNLGERRLEIFGQNSTFYSKDGTRVLTKYTMTIPNNVEFITLNIIPGNRSNEFWLYKALGKDISSEVKDICESFRIETKDHLSINIAKRTFQMPNDFIKSISSIGDKSAKKSPNAEINGNDVQFQNYYSFTITWPNGVITESVHDNNSEISHIKQYFLIPLSDQTEDMRFISVKGEVIIFKSSGVIDVLNPDGSIVKITKYLKKIIQPIKSEDNNSETSSEKSKKDKKKTKDKLNKTSRVSKNTIIDNASEIVPPEYELVIDEYETIDYNGHKVKWINDKPIPIEKCMIRTATDYCLQEVLSRRTDGTKMLLNSKGSYVVTFPDNTRIITNYFIEQEEIYPEWTDDELKYFDTLDVHTIDSDTQKTQESSISFDEACFTDSYHAKERCDGYVSVQINFTIERETFPSVIVNKADGKISVISPNNTQLTIDKNNNYLITLDDMTSADFDGKTISIKYEACAECDTKTNISINVSNDDIFIGSDEKNQNWVEMCDSFGKHIVVDEEGNIFITNEDEDCTIDDDDLTDNNILLKGNETKSDISKHAHEKCRDMCAAKSMRFIVQNRDLSCSELVHRTLVDEYMQSCRGQPWCSINQYDTFGDHRSLISILTPVNVTESEKWLMDSMLADKPTYLKYKDLKDDSGKGFYHWMRPYGRFTPEPRKTENALPPRLPRAYIIRTLEKQWQDSKRTTLKGAKELIRAILRYRDVINTNCDSLLADPIKDPRSEEERRSDDDIQSIGQRIYEDLKCRITDHVVTRATADITTEAPPTSVAMRPDLGGLALRTARAVDHETQLKELEAAERPSPNLQRYWRQRAQQAKDEEFYKYLLREGSVPPYFRNILGGAVWWEVSNAVEQAARLGEGGQVTCACPHNESQDD